MIEQDDAVQYVCSRVVHDPLWRQEFETDRASKLAGLQLTPEQYSAMMALDVNWLTSLQAQCANATAAAVGSIYL